MYCVPVAYVLCVCLCTYELDCVYCVPVAYVFAIACCCGFCFDAVDISPSQIVFVTNAGLCGLLVSE